MSKLGLIAGGGGLPVEIAEHCERSGRPLFVVRLKGFAGEAGRLLVLDREQTIALADELGVFILGVEPGQP